MTSGGMVFLWGHDTFDRKEKDSQERENDHTSSEYSVALENNILCLFVTCGNWVSLFDEGL